MTRASGIVARGAAMKFYQWPGNYSPPFWEILLDTVTAESPTGEG
jgi:hypothetical protein